MFRIILLCLIIYKNEGTNSFPDFNLDGKIIGGEQVDIKDYPYQLSYQFLGSHICGASIISERKALTAAHCTHRLPVSKITIRVGSTTINKGGDIIKVASVCQHPNYNAINYDNDVTVLILSSSITYSDHALPISLIKQGVELPASSKAVATGWGHTTEGGYLSTYLRKVTLVKISDSDCLSFYGKDKFTTNMLCFGYLKGGKDTCQGDSGGPLVFNGEQIGIVSWGTGCGRPQLPGIYCKISKIRTFIDSCQ